MEVQNDLQAIVNCTRGGDTLLLPAARATRLAARVTIPWSLTISANVEDTDLVDGIFPEASRKLTLFCLRQNEGIFLIRYVH